MPLLENSSTPIEPKVVHGARKKGHISTSRSTQYNLRTVTPYFDPTIQSNSLAHTPPHHPWCDPTNIHRNLTTLLFVHRGRCITPTACPGSAAFAISKHMLRLSSTVTHVSFPELACVECRREFNTEESCITERDKLKRFVPPIQLCNCSELDWAPSSWNNILGCECVLFGVLLCHIFELSNVLYKEAN